MENGLVPYSQFIKGIKDLVYRRQYEALKRVNTELIQLYWEIGGEIARKQSEDGWGNSIVEILSKKLQREFPGVQGFSARNLWLMRSFCLEYSQNTNLQPKNASDLALENHLANEGSFDQGHAQSPKAARHRRRFL